MNLIKDIKNKKKEQDAIKFKDRPLGHYDKKKYACGFVLRLIYTALAIVGIYITLMFSLLMGGSCIYFYLYNFGGQGTPADLMVAGGGSLFIVFWACVLSFLLVRLIYRKFMESWKKAESYFTKVP